MRSAIGLMGFRPGAARWISAKMTVIMLTTCRPALIKPDTPFPGEPRASKGVLPPKTAPVATETAIPNALNASTISNTSFRVSR